MNLVHRKDFHLPRALREGSSDHFLINNDISNGHPANQLSEKDLALWNRTLCRSRISAAPLASSWEGWAKY